MPSLHQSVPQLRRRRLGVIHLVFFTVAASAPMTVLGGGVATTFAVTGNAGVPLSFLILAVALALFAVGYAAMSRHVANAGAFYSYLAQGLGRGPAVAGSFVALVAYNAHPDRPLRPVRRRARRLRRRHLRPRPAVVGLGAARTRPRRRSWACCGSTSTPGPRRAARPGVHRGAALRHRRVRPPRRRRRLAPPASPAAPVRAGRRRGASPSASPLHRLRVRRDLQRGVPEPAGPWPAPPSSRWRSPACSTRSRPGR